MPVTFSNQIAIGTQAPDFNLGDAEGRIFSLSDVAGAKAVLVAFISNRCPYVLHIQEAFSAYARDYAAKGVRVIAINSNDASSYPVESLAASGERAREFGYDFIYLKDENQDVAKAYGAACTPDLYLFDGDLKLFYHGQFDGSRPKNDVPVTGADLRAATDLLLTGQSPPADQKNAIGCNIKWIAGKEPSWFGAPAAAE
ncbi:thioredoxin family protein [Aestuariivirga sp.]|uniref:thioredoxin family protein n=1 Tax=Aestuariivirga sp. TaxID=2650926 RepID=UPI0039E4D6C4